MLLRNFHLFIVFFVLACPLTFAESEQNDEGAPAPSGEVWSKPESGQTREEPETVTATPEQPGTVTATPEPSAPPRAAEPAPAPTSPEVWSTPAPGTVRQDQGPVWTPPPAYYPPPPPARYRRYYRPEAPPDDGRALTEVGLSLGPPSILNVNLGYWGSREFPMLFRLSGMYYGDNRGIQADVGYILSRNAFFKQYVAISAISFQATTNYYSFWSGNSSYYKDIFNGVGPSYGFNWNRLSFQVGVAFGNDLSTQSTFGRIPVGE